MEIQEETLNLIRCQECLQKLHSADGSLICGSCKKQYPLHNGLVFMGYDAKKEEEINEIIEEERDHQNNLNDIETHFQFAYGSFRIALLAIPQLKKLIKRKNPVALDVGSGGAPFSKMLAKSGFNTFRLELDPNSLYSGLFYEHPNLKDGKHIVADGSLLPFADNSIDVVFCKEFIHHIEDFHSIFAEINRALRVGGIFLMIEPTNKFKFLRTKAENDSIKRPGHHLSTIFKYDKSLKRNGMKIKNYYLYHYKPSQRMKMINWYKKYNLKQMQDNIPANKSLIPFKMFVQRVISGQNVVYAQKEWDSPYKVSRPEIKTVKPSQLIINKAYLRDPRLNGYNKILNELESELASTS